MKTAVAALALVCLASPAMAISRYNSLDRTCEAAHQAIDSEKSVLLRYPSRSGKVVLYDRYVTDTNQCGTNFYAARTYVPTKDNPSCPVYNCKSSSALDPR
jgi:hypothetical protein